MPASQDKRVLVKLSYFSCCPPSKPTLASKSIKVLRLSVEPSKFEHVVKLAMGISGQVVLKRKSKRHSNYVNLSSDSDYKALERLLKVKDHIELIVLQQKYRDVIEAGILYKQFVAQKLPSITKSAFPDETAALQHLNSCLQVMKKNVDALRLLMEQMDEKHEMIVAQCLEPSVSKEGSVVQTIAEAQESSKPSVVHSNVVCDGCGNDDTPLVGVRYMCTNCDNYDLCEKCLLNGVVTGKHQADHCMMRIPVPKPSGSCVSRFLQRSNCLLSSNRYCDVCYERTGRKDIIKGVYFNCILCQNWDACSECYLNGARCTDSGLQASSYTEANVMGKDTWFDYVAANAQNFKQNANCDVCSEGLIRGVANKCKDCFNYDLCDACFDAGKTLLKHETHHRMVRVLPGDLFTKESWEKAHSDKDGVVIDVTMLRNSALAQKLESVLAGDELGGLEQLVAKAEAYEAIQKLLGENALERAKDLIEAQEGPKEKHVAEKTGERKNAPQENDAKASTSQELKTEIEDSETEAGSSSDETYEVPDAYTDLLSDPLLSEDSSKQGTVTSSATPLSSSGTLTRSINGSQSLKSGSSLIVLPKLAPQTSSLTIEVEQKDGEEKISKTEKPEERSYDSESDGFMDVDVVSSGYDSDEGHDLLVEYEILDSDMECP